MTKLLRNLKTWTKVPHCQQHTKECRKDLGSGRMSPLKIFKPTNFLTDPKKPKDAGCPTTWCVNYLTCTHKTEWSRDKHWVFKRQTPHHCLNMRIHDSSLPLKLTIWGKISQAGKEQMGNRATIQAKYTAPQPATSVHNTQWEHSHQKESNC